MATKEEPTDMKQQIILQILYSKAAYQHIAAEKEPTYIIVPEEVPTHMKQQIILLLYSKAAYYFQHIAGEEDPTSTLFTVLT